MRQTFTTKIITLSILAASTLCAAPNISDAQRQVQPPREVQEGVKNVIPSLPVETLKEPMVEEDGKQIEVKGFKLSGVVHMNEDKLLSRINGYVGQNHTFSELQKMTSLITKAYREEGYFVARAYIPKQSMKEGILEITVIEGQYGEFHLKNSSLVSDKMVQAMLDEAKDDNVVNTSSLERSMLILNDTAGVKVTGADIKPAQNVGSSDFDITTEATKPYSAYIIGDNYGSKYTGRYRINAGVSANSPFGYGDKLGFSGVTSTTTDLKNGKVYYNAPLMANGLRSEVSVAKTTYALSEDYEAQDALGNATTFEASLLYPIIKTRLETLNFALGYVYKNMKDEIRSSDTLIKKESDAANLTFSYMRNALFLGLNSTINASITLTQGNLSFDDANERAIDQAGAKTNGEYTKVSGSVEKSLQFNPEYALTTSLRFQKALNHKNLDGSEDFSVCGAYGVRAFPDGEHSAENGYIVGAEFFYTLPSMNGMTHKGSIFADSGYAKMENPTAATDSRHLSDVGLGYQVSYKEFFAKAQLARVVGGEKVTSESERSMKLLLQVGWIY